MDRLHQSASTRFPSRIRIVTTDISISFNLALTDSAPQEKLFLGSYKVIQAIRSLPKSCYRSNVLWLMITSSFTCLDRTITKCLLSFAITITLKKKYLDSIRHLVAASLKMFSPFFRYILSLHIIGVNVMFKPSKYKDMCTLIRNSTSSESYLPCTQLDHE